MNRNGNICDIVRAFSLLRLCQSIGGRKRSAIAEPALKQSRHVTFFRFVGLSALPGDGNRTPASPIFRQVPVVFCERPLLPMPSLPNNVCYLATQTLNTTPLFISPVQWSFPNGCRHRVAERIPARRTDRISEISSHKNAGFYGPAIFLLFPGKYPDNRLFQLNETGIERIVFIVKANEHDAGHFTVSRQEATHRSNSNFRRLFFGKPIYAGTDIGKCDSTYRMVCGYKKAIEISRG